MTMKMSSDPDWLRRMAEKEDNCCVSAGNPEFFSDGKLAVGVWVSNRNIDLRLKVVEIGDSSVVLQHPVLKESTRWRFDEFVKNWEACDE